MTKGNQNISCLKFWREVQWVNDADRSGADAIRAGCAFLFFIYFFFPQLFLKAFDIFSA